MEVLRTIGRHEILVNVSASAEISLEEATLLGIASKDAVGSQSKREILQALSTGDEYFPLSLHWELLDRCNLSCPFCYIVGHSSNPVLRFPQIQPHIADLIEEGLLFCTLTGGEVTIHPDFSEIYTFLKANGVLVEVFTNGYKLDDNLVELFLRYPPYAVEVSLYTMDDAKIRSAYGANNDNVATTVLRNVLRLKNEGVNVVGKTFLNALTDADIGGIQAWCQDNGIEHYSSSDFTPAYDGVDISGFRLASGIVPIRGAPLRSHNRNVCFPCGTKNYGCALTPSFEIFPCSSIRHRDCYFDLRQLGVRESLLRMKTFMRKFQDTEIVGACGGTVGCKTCIAFATPSRNASGDIVFFAQT
jgi:MoaA/NifB/PqqE/SkfB family radical SAM enzyme